MKFLNNLKLDKKVLVDFTAEVPVSTGDDLSRKLYWDDQERTLSLEMGNGVIQQIGQEQFYEVKNNTLNLITNGTLVMFSGALEEAGRITVSPAIADGSFSSEYVIGIATEDIDVGENGLVTNFGVVRGINTSGEYINLEETEFEEWGSGDILYANPLFPGRLTKFRPEAPQSVVTVAVVLYADDENGIIFVRPTFYSTLGELQDVEIDSTLEEDQLIFYNTLNSRWENIQISDIRFAAEQIDFTSESYPDVENVEEALELSFDRYASNYDYITDLLSTGVYEFEGITQVDDTHFSVGAAKGYIVDNTTDPNNPIVIPVNFTGQTNIEATNIGSSYQTQVFINVEGNLVFSNTEKPMCEERRNEIFLGRVVHPTTVITAIENVPDHIQSPAAQLRDLWKGLGQINDRNYVYAAQPNTNLTLGLHGGTIYYNGINFVNNPKRPTRADIPSQVLLSFNYRTQTGLGSNAVTSLNPTVWDNNGTITTIAAVPNYATNQRVYLNSNGLVLIQYGQTVYSTLGDAIAGVATESFTVFPAIEANTILIGVISIRRGATTLGNGDAKFHGVSKFGELGGGGAGAGAAVAAQDVAIVDSGDYFTGTNVELALQEIGLALSEVVDTNTVSVVEAGNSIGVSSSYNAETDTYTYTVAHSDTSTLTGSYGTEGIKSVTVDENGHVTAVSTETYLKGTTQSKDFGAIIVTDTDQDYTWADTGSMTADANADTITFVSGEGIEIDIDAAADAIRVKNTAIYSHPTQAAITSDNSNGTVLQDISINTLGHVTSVGTTDLDNRYYTETELDNGQLDNRYYTETEVNNLLTGKLNTTLKGAANGLAELDSAGHVPASQLPSYVDDVLEFAEFATLPITGETGKIYVTLNDNLTYRWSGTAYVEISKSLALGETDSTAYRGDRGKIAYDHGFLTNNPHSVTYTQVGAAPTNHTHTINDVTDYVAYTLPKASDTVLGGIKVGANLEVLADGTLNSLSSVNDFTDLNDAPNTYSGQAQKLVAVNSTEDGLEFIPNIAYSTIITTEEFVTEEGQLEFTLTKGSYTPNTNRLNVYIWGVKQYNTAYIETSGTTFELVAPVPTGTRIIAEYFTADPVLKGDTGPSITSAGFVSNDIVFTKDDTSTVTLTDAAITLKGADGETGPSIIAAAFDNNDIVFTKDDDSIVTLVDAKIDLKGDTGEKGDTGDSGVYSGSEEPLDPEKNVWIDFGGEAFELIAESVNIDDIGDYYTSTNVEEALQEIGNTLINLSADAVDISIDDVGEYYTSDNVEGALQEIGLNFADLTVDVDGGMFGEMETEIAIDGGTF